MLWLRRGGDDPRDALALAPALPLVRGVDDLVRASAGSGGVPTARVRMARQTAASARDRGRAGGGDVPGALAFSTLTPALAPAWDEFVRLHDDGWFWHTSAWIEYQRHYRAGNRDASFAIVDEDTGSLLGVVPLMISRATD